MEDGKGEREKEGKRKKVRGGRRDDGRVREKVKREMKSEVQERGRQ